MRSGAENKPTNQLKNMARSRSKPGSAKTRITSAPNQPGFAFHEKKKLRDARRNLRRQKEQMSAVQAVMQEQ